MCILQFVVKFEDACWVYKTLIPNKVTNSSETKIRKVVTHFKNKLEEPISKTTNEYFVSDSDQCTKTPINCDSHDEELLSIFLSLTTPISTG
jgi:hypothetical protein